MCFTSSSLMDSRKSNLIFYIFPPPNINWPFLFLLHHSRNLAYTEIEKIKDKRNFISWNRDDDSKWQSTFLHGLKLRMLHTWQFWIIAQSNNCKTTLKGYKSNIGPWTHKRMQTCAYGKWRQKVKRNATL